MGPRTWTGVTQERWSNPGAPRSGVSLLGRDSIPRYRGHGPEWLKPWDIGHGPESSGKVGQPVDLRPCRKSPGTAGRNRGPLDQDRSHPGTLVDPGCPQTKRESPGTPNRHHGTSGTVLSRPGCWSKAWTLRHGPESSGKAGRPMGLRPGHESPVTAVRPHGHSDAGRSFPG